MARRPGRGRGDAEPGRSVVDRPPFRRTVRHGRALVRRRWRTHRAAGRASCRCGGSCPQPARLGRAARERGAVRGPVATRGRRPDLRHSQARRRGVHARRLCGGGHHVRRSGGYMIELRARESLYMPAVAWAYPAPPAGQRQTVPAAPVIPAEAARNYRYGLQVPGDSPPWRPISVFDDGRRVYVVFPAGIVQGEMPPIFVLGSDGEPQIVNSRIHQNVLIVDRLFGAAELRLGSGNRQQVVRIVRTNQTQAAAESASTTTGGSSS
ncbi:MAG: TrbG/VirB9 family P-type conjugative transfer protein [Rhodobacterales bacterium]|nr:TrbG/VirB9 family P-type conjugative transfer protein [Rhodobacterales bacterium]MDX5499583.1 TrbG/VirB9 family P-type conjugative transfer protein [Rhodobacterales bacterium]